MLKENQSELLYHTNVSTRQYPTTNAENEENDVGKETGEIDQLSGDFDSSNDHEKDDQPGEDESQKKLPYKSGRVFYAWASLQDHFSRRMQIHKDKPLLGDTNLSCHSLLKEK